MESNYKASAKASATAQAVYNGIKVSSKVGTTFTGIRKTVQIMRKALLDKREEVEKQCKELSETYSSAVATPQIETLKSGYRNDVAMRRRQLTDTLQGITEGKRKAIERFTMRPPTDEMIRLFNAYNVRTKDTVSDEEWSYLVSAVGNNYLALRMVQTLSEKLDKPFVMPFTPDESLKTLDKLDNIVSLAINSIDTPSP